MHGQKIQKALPAGQRHAAPVRAVPVAGKDTFIFSVGPTGRPTVRKIRIKMKITHLL